MSSSLWPVPARPSTWFSAEQIAESNRYHKPLQFVAVARTLARIAGMLSAFWLGGWWLGSDADSSSTALSGAASGGAASGGAAVTSGEVGDVVSLLVMCGLVALAFWLPATVSDWWFDQVHEPRFGSERLPRHRLAVGSLVSGAVLFVGLAGAAAVLSWAVNASQYWFIVLPAIAMGIASLGAVLGHRVAMRARTLTALDPESIEGSLFGDLPLDAVALRVMNDRVESGWNALSTNSRGRPTIAMTRSLLEAPLEVRRLIVAHELGHLRLGHLGQTLRLGLAQAALLGLGSSWMLAPWGLGLLAIETPIASLPVVVLVVWLLEAVLNLGGAWLNRAHERQADAVAFELAQPMTLHTMRTVHTTGRADLAPGLLSRLTSSHPPPAERLHRFSVRPAD